MFRPEALATSRPTSVRELSAKLITVYAAASPVADGLVGGPENRLLLAAWLPNLLFAALGIVLVARAPK